MKKKTARYNIRGDEWKLILLNSEMFLKTHPDQPNSTAVTIQDDKEIYFKACEFTPYHIRHELVHAKFKYMCLHDTNSISVDDMEEIFAKYMGEFGEEHVKMAEDIFKKLKKFAEKISQSEKS